MLSVAPVWPEQDPLLLPRVLGHSPLSVPTHTFPTEEKPRALGGGRDSVSNQVAECSKPQP